MKNDTTTIRITKLGKFWHAEKQSGIPFLWTTILLDSDPLRLEQVIGQWFPNVKFDYPSTQRPQHETN